MKRAMLQLATTHVIGDDRGVGQVDEVDLDSHVDWGFWQNERVHCNAKPQALHGEQPTGPIHSIAVI
jgi:hypothetical protein